jgi:hypothetical protein
MRRVGKASAVARRAKVEACPPFRVRLPTDGGHGARAPLAHPTESIFNSVIRRHSFAISQHVCARFNLIVWPSDTRAQGRPGAQCTRSLVCVVESTRVSHHGHTGYTRIPRAMVLTVYFVLPGDRALLPPSLADSFANLTPASGCQDHTTLTSASRAVVYGAISVHLLLPARQVDFRNSEINRPQLWGERSRWNPSSRRSGRSSRPQTPVVIGPGVRHGDFG